MKRSNRDRLTLVPPEDSHYYRCSFCGRRKEDVEMLLAGPEDFYLCDQCVDLCAEAVAKYRAGRKAETGGHLPPPERGHE